MFLGIIDFGYNNFYLFGFIGYIVLFVYLCFVIFFIVNVKSSITYINQLWYIPFLLCVVFEIMIYFTSKIGRNK